MFRKLKKWALRDKTLVYCGLNHGHTFRQIVHRFGRAVGFEPIPALYRQLRDEFADDPSIEIVHGALTETNEAVTFNILDADAASSVGTLSESYKQQHQRFFEVVESIEVPSYHLGEFLAERGIHRVDTLITDVQGFDLAVLKTVSSLIRARAIRTITCEVEQDAIPPSYENVPSNKEKEFFEFLADDYQLVKRRGEDGWSFNDLTWVRSGSKNQAIYV